MERVPRIDQLVLRWEELQQEGCALSIAEFCRDCPDLLPEFQQQVEKLQSMDDWLGVGTPIDGIASAETLTSAGVDASVSEQYSASVGPSSASADKLGPIANANHAVTADPSEPASEDTGFCDFLSPPEEADEIGRLGSYRVVKVLGRGGMGVVFKAMDPSLKRFVALKAMLPRIAASQSARKRFLREARTAASINHDNIVTIFQVGEDRGTPFMAMEFLKGEPLDVRLSRVGVLPVAEVLRIGREIAEGLAAAHDGGLIHRDIKPGNIWLEARDGRDRGEISSSLISRRPRVKILDFGLARSTFEEIQLTQSGAILGTPAYMAPEQAVGNAVDHRCDLFSLGCVLYRLCTGEQPFQGKDVLSLLSALATNTPRPAHELNPSLPRELSLLVARLLAKDPAERPDNAHEVAQCLHELEQQNESSALASDSGSSIRPSKSNSKRRNRILIAAAALLLTVALSGLVFFLQTRDGTIRIEVNDPKIEVTLQTTGVTIRGAWPKEISVRPGKHLLHIKHDNLEFDTDAFLLSSGEQTRLRVDLLAGSIQVTKDGHKIGHAERQFTGPTAIPKTAANTPVKPPPPTKTAASEGTHLDPTFGSGGKVLTPIGSGDGIAESNIVLQPDGKIVLAGKSYNGSNFDFAVVRYNVDGSLDKNFGNDGKVTTDFGSTNEEASGIAIQPDGKLVVVGRSASASFDFAIVRYNREGSLDLTFGPGGKVITPVLDSIDLALDVAIQSDGKIVVSGVAYDGGRGGDVIALVRYNANGTLDSSFSGGKITTALGPGSSGTSGNSVTLVRDGKILVAGFANNEGADFAVSRYQANGSLDGSFGVRGTVSTPVGPGTDAAYGIVLQPDGKIVVVGRAQNPTNCDWAVVRYHENGSLDGSFGIGGKVTTQLGSGNAIAVDVVLQADGKIVVAGHSSSGSTNDFAVVRYNADGSLDGTFGNSGKLILPLGPGDDTAWGIAVQPDGKIVVAGNSFNGLNYDFAVVRFSPKK